MREASLAPGEFEIWLAGVERLDLSQVGRALLALSAIESARARGVGDDAFRCED